MDWFSWLSKTSLDSSILHEYAQAFSQNELEEEDITYFSHEFLQSMGITIAKHRLEILKLARREKSHGLKNPFAKLLYILKKTKKSLTNYIVTLFHGENSRAIISVSKKNKLKRKNKVNGGAISYSSRWKKAMMMRNTSKKLVMINSGIINNNQEKLMLTNSDYFEDYFDDYDNNDDDMMVVSTPKLDCYSSSLMHELQQKSKEEKINYDDHDDHKDDDDHEDYDHDHDDQDDDLSWTPVLEEIRWDAMFQDLKPN